MFQFAKKLLERGVIKSEQIVFVDFAQYSNEILDPQELLNNYFDINPVDEPFLIFDEIQDIANFKAFVLFFYNKGYKVFLSGSNSKLLSSELSTEFR
jgi:predicted AAA+ superfamily ATPase